MAALMQLPQPRFPLAAVGGRLLESHPAQAAQHQRSASSATWVWGSLWLVFQIQIWVAGSDWLFFGIGVTGAPLDYLLFVLVCLTSFIWALFTWAALLLMVLAFLVVLLVALFAAVGAGMPSFKTALYFRISVEPTPFGSHRLVLVDVSPTASTSSTRLAHPGLSHSALTTIRTQYGWLSRRSKDLRLRARARPRGHNLRARDSGSNGIRTSNPLIRSSV